MDITVRVRMDLNMYPYDRHIVPFYLATRATIDAQGTQTKWKLCQEWPGWAPAKYHEDKVMLSEDQTTKDLEYKHKQCFAYLDGKRAIFCVLLERHPTRVIQRTTVPVFIVVCIALSVTGIKGGSFQDEFSAALTSLLTLTGLYYTVQSSLPKQPMPYLAWADFYFLARLSAIDNMLLPSLHLRSSPPGFDQPRVTAVWLHLPLRHCHQGHHRIASVR